MNFNFFDNNYYFYENIIVLGISLIPAIFILVGVLISDTKNREPIPNIVLCLLSGFITIGLVLFFNQYTPDYISIPGTIQYVFGHAAIEEFCKLLLFMSLVYFGTKYDEIYDGIVYMCFIALSFAAIENTMYAFNESTFVESISTALVRDVTTIPVHVMCGILLGYFLSLSKFSKDIFHKILNIFLGITIACLTHGAYNYFISNLPHTTRSLLAYIVFIIIPLFSFVIILFMISKKFIKKSKTLNDIFLSNGRYDKRHNYLHTKSSYKGK
ncbi:MAG TPA: PrsW family intramembrane metalloprotease [Bacilli bacterium]|nr:PrsW family intramembrane metalloprotease [Bacilli bacterium]